MTLLGQATLQARAPSTPYGPPPREVYDLATSSGSAIITSATAAFTSTDIGKLVAGLNIPFGATISSVQSATQATMSANATTTFSPTTATIGSLASAPPPGVAVPRSPAGHIVNIIGDSIAPQQSTSVAYMGGDGSSSMAWAHLLSDGQIVQGKQAGIGSQRIDHMLQRLYADILPFPAHFCLIQTSTNDLSFGHSPATWASYLRQMCAALLAAGQTPVLVTGPPVPSAYRAGAERYRRFLVAFAYRQGLPVVDAYGALADTNGSGGYLAAYDSGDGTHPNLAGYRAYGQAIADALAPLMHPWKPPLPRANGSAASLLDNGLFLLDANSDGVPDGWAKTGAGGAIASIVANDTGIVGNALRLVDTTNTGAVTLTATTTGTVAPGSRWAATGRVKVDGTGLCKLLAYSNGTYPGARIVFNWSGITSPTGGWRRFYVEGTNGLGTARTLNFELSTSGDTATDISIAQVGLYDLTAAGL